MQIPLRKKRQIVPFCAHIVTLFYTFTPFLPLLAVPPSRKSLYNFLRLPWDSLAYIRGQRNGLSAPKTHFSCILFAKDLVMSKIITTFVGEF